MAEATYGCAAGLGLDNLLLLTDSYKVSHFKQYPPGTRTICSYFESRGGRHVDVNFFGLQYFLKRYLCGQVVTAAKIDEAEAVYTAHFPDTLFPRDKWEYILEKHGGKLPIDIAAVPEGTTLPYKNCVMTVENTDPECFWLTNYLETLLVQVWYPMTVSSNSRMQKRAICQYLRDTGDPAPTAAAPFKMHDFGFRGVSSVETAAVGDAAHLIHFMGTDTIAGLVLLRDFYGAPGGPANVAGYSIPASEHSTITSWGKDGELDAFKNMLTQFPTGLVACVSDSYDIYKACGPEGWGSPELKEMILSRDGALVVRPDSGDPKEVCLRILEILGESIGMYTNEAGFKVLDDHVRIIQGDGIDYESVVDIMEHLASNGWSITNIAFGSGGGLLQKMNRDTQKCAFKCSFIRREIDGVVTEMAVFKDPITSPGKKSKKGRLSVHRVADLGEAATAWLNEAGKSAEEIAEIRCVPRACSARRSAPASFCRARSRSRGRRLPPLSPLSLARSAPPRPRPAPPAGTRSRRACATRTAGLRSSRARAPISARRTFSSESSQTVSS
jgi:nicotinamide phosphoribosyltransferase